MNEWLTGAALAVWFGILTSISPCPLATNIAAISYIGKKVEHPRLVLLTGLLYTLGRAVTYLVLGVLLVKSLLSAPHVSFFLQRHMIKIMGPVMIVVGMMLLGLVNLRVPATGTSGRIMDRVDRIGIWGGGLLGIIFALSFCPTSAALFFGSLVPLAVRAGSGVALPLLYGVGTALPVVVFAILIAMGAHFVGRAFRRITQIELWARRITGFLFICMGVYFSLKYIFKIF
ncbi:MAG TPA: aromatic aminobenezylarsenical efflux permease ArsG family transporter [Patescibacteria group bacterium]|nr:aromatic aminobenezylarsenical efflux permease ArsG family transporter [Patescibacteria group bacterium]